MRTSVVWAIAASLLVASFVASVSLWQTPKYEATARVLVGVKTKDARPGIHPIPNATSGLQTATLTVAKAVPTTPIARAVVERLNLPRGSAKEVLGNMSVEQDPSTMFIDITYEDSEAKRTQLVANAIGQVVSQRVHEVSLGKSRMTATLWKPAKLPAEPVSPNPLRNGLIALVAGLLLSVVVIAVLAEAKLKAEPKLGPQIRRSRVKGREAAMNRERFAKVAPRALLRPAKAELKLSERFEAASLDFATTYLWKARLARAGVRFYSSSELYEDLYAAAGDYELFPVALWAYFRLLHTTD